MTRPVHFADQHTLARQQWLQALQEAERDERAAMGMLTGAMSWAAIIAVGVLIGFAYADWVTGEHLATEIVSQWRDRT